MKKFLFLILSMAVAGTAFAGIRNAEQIGRKETVKLIQPTKTSVKLTAGNLFVKQVQTNFNARPGQPAKLRTGNIITEQPEGTVKYYNRVGTSWHRYYDSQQAWSGGVNYTAQDGQVMVVENGNNVWFQNLLYDPDHYFDDYWIKGIKTGNTIRVQMGQEMLNYSDGSSIVLYMGTLEFDGSNFTWTRGNASRAEFTVNGDVLTLANSASDGNYGGTCLGADWDDGYGWAGFADFETVLTFSGETPENPNTPTMYTDDDIDAMATSEDQLVAYFRTGNAFYCYVDDPESIYQGEQYGIMYIYNDADGETVYMRDPVFGMRDQHIWVKGTKSGNKITVPLGQYLMFNSSNNYGVKTAWGEVTFPEENTVDFTLDNTVTECTYTIDGNKITLDGTSEYIGLATVMDSAGVDFSEVVWFPNLDYSTTYYTYPATPENLVVTPAATTADVAWTDTEDSQWNLRYRVYNPALDAAYSSDFDTSESLDGWGIIDLDGDNDSWGWYGDPDDSNNGVLASLSYGKSPDNWMLSADVFAAEGSVVSFDAWGYNGSAAGTSEKFSVLIAPLTAETTDDFVAIVEDVTTNGAEHSTFTYNIPEEFIGDSCFFAIRHTGGAGYIMIDNFFVGNPDATPNAWIYINEVTTNPYTITGLTPETTYEVQVQGANEGGYGDWSQIAKFTTLAQAAGLRGDVNDDGDVTITDVTVLIQHLLSKVWDDVPGEFSLDNADCNLDGSPTITDVTVLIQYLLSKTWPAE